MDREQAANELARRGVTLEDMRNYFLTVAEPVAAMGSGIVAEPLAGFAGLAAAPFGSDAAANAVNYYRDKLTYSPRSEAGQSGMAAVGEAMAPIGEAMDYAASGAGDYIYDKTGSPALAAAAYSAPTAALELLGLKGVNQLSKSGKLGQPLEFGDIGSGGVGNKQRGIFAGVKAKGADLKRQAAAEELANRGIGRDQIWQETGWFNDVDGSWKFEIDDSQRNYTPIREPNPKDVEVAQLRADEARMAVKKFGKDNAEAYKNPRSPLHKEQLVADLKRLTDNDKRARANLDSVKAGTSEIVMGKAFDSEFMNDYPELRGLGFEHKEMPLEIRGSFDDSGDGSIMVNKGMGLPDQESTLLHETQHAIQEREGFARGGNPDSFDKIDPLAVKQAETVKGWVEATGMPADELMKGKPPTGLGSEWLKTTKPWAERPEFLAKMKEDAYFGANPFESYQRLAGEAEARNVQTRMDYTPEQRQAAAPWTTLDVPESELIVRGNSNGPMMSVSKAQAIEELRRRAEVEQNLFDSEMVEIRKQFKSNPERKQELMGLMKQKRARLDSVNQAVIREERAAAPKAKTKIYAQRELKPYRGKAYHQTSAEFDDFDLSKSADGTAWFTSSLDNFTKEGSAASAASGKGRIVEADIDLKNVAGWDEMDKFTIDELVSRGYDGALLDGDIQVFDKEAIKSTGKGVVMAP